MTVSTSQILCEWNVHQTHCHVQYKPNGSQTWRLYADYIGHNIALPKLVQLENGYEMPMLLWTAKGRDFIFDLAEREMPRWYA